MDPLLLDQLADPVSGQRLHFEAGHNGADGELVADNGARYPVRSGIPRFVGFSDAGQEQTADAFGYKWGRIGSYDSPSMRSSATAWLLERYGFASPAEMRRHLEAKGSLLDVGCGAGFSTSLWFDGWAASRFVGVDISAAIDLAKDRLGAAPNTSFVQADALQLPFRSGTFGAVIAEGVFHHTPSTRAAIFEAARVTEPGGEVLFYVYRRKSPVREWTDDSVRRYLAALDNDEAWAEMESLTELGRQLAELKASVSLPREVRSLGIPAGPIDVQRLIYWHFAKLFWNDDYSFDENVHVNFDWYRPTYAHRQSESEIREWCYQSGLEIMNLHEDPAGYTVRAIRGAPTS